MLVGTNNHHLTDHREAGIVNDVEGTRGYYHLSHPHLLWIADSKVIGVQCQQPFQCHHSLTGLKPPSILGMADDIGRLEPT